MAEPIKINLYDPVADKALWQTAQNFQGEPDTVYVFAHGSPTQVADYSKGRAHPEFLGPLELSQMMDKRGASRQSRVVLVACSTAQGEHSIARESTRYYEIVVAPTRTLWVETSARNEYELFAESTIAGSGQQQQPDLHDPGKVKIHFGADHRFCNEHPQECDPPQSERPPPTHEINAFGTTLSIQETDTVYPVTRFKPGKASKPISPDEAIQLQEAMAKLFLNIVELKGEHAQLARQQAIHHYPELAHAFAAYDSTVQQSKGRSDFKELLGEREAEIMYAIQQGKTYTLDTGANTKSYADPIGATEAQAYSR